MKLREEDFVLIDLTNLFHNFIAQSHHFLSTPFLFISYKTGKIKYKFYCCKFFDSWVRV